MFILHGLLLCKLSENDSFIYLFIYLFTYLFKLIYSATSI